MQANILDLGLICNALSPQSEQQMEDLFKDMYFMLTVIMIVCLIVILAIIADLCCGLSRAMRDNEKIKPKKLVHTLSKFILYECGVVLAGGIDVLMYISHIRQSIPVVACIVGIFLLIVEIISICKSLDKETRANASQAGKIVIEKEAFIKELVTILNKNDNNE